VSETFQAEERSWPYATWGAKAAVLGAIVALLAGLLLSLPVVIAFSPGDGEELGTAATVLAQICTAIGFLAVPFWLASRPGGGALATFRRLGFRRFDSSAIGWIVVAAVGYFLFVAVWASFVLKPEQEEIADKFGPLPVQALLIVVAASFSEEICFRGMLFGGLRHRMGRIAAAVAAASVFGVLHATTGVSAVPPLIAFGFALALLYEKTGSLWPPIILHAFNNSLALLATA
jgi:membrane protease YdiL (CAAX protease family)